MSCRIPQICLRLVPATRACRLSFNVGRLVFFFSSRRRHTRSLCDWSSDVCSSDLRPPMSPSRLPPPSHFDSFIYRVDPTWDGGGRRDGLMGGLDVSRTFKQTKGTYAEIGRASCRERV